MKSRLITIPISHYCEKARWALDWCGLPYQEERHIQFFHIPFVYKAGGGSTAPVLVTSQETLSDSSQILQWANSQAQESRKLFPSDSKLRKEMEAFEDYLDEGFGVAGRLWMYSYMLQEIPLILKYTRGHGVPGHELKLFPFVFPFVSKAIRTFVGLKPESQVQSREAVSRALDRVADRLNKGNPFLFGESFSAADLTFAALAAAVLIPEKYGVTLPALKELPDAMRTQVEIWREHPAGQYALKMYQNYRRPGS